MRVKPNTASIQFDELFQYKEERMNGIFKIANYIDDGFEKICDVQYYYDSPLQNKIYNYEWEFFNVNRDLLFSEHRSWVYHVVEDDEIVKTGESGLRLGIPYKRVLSEYYVNNPRSGSSNRFGRLKSQPGERDTDYVIRRELFNGGNISLWAKKCATIEANVIIAGEEVKVEQTTHKHQELAYLKYFNEKAGRYPRLNRTGR